MKYILLYGDKMYLLNSLLLTSDKETIKTIYLKVYNFLCHDNIEDIETFELINGEISTDEVFIQKLFNTIINEDSETLYNQIISIYQQIFTFYFLGESMYIKTNNNKYLLLDNDDNILIECYNIIDFNFKILCNFKIKDIINYENFLKIYKR